jgi:hypothetical protein
MNTVIKDAILEPYYCSRDNHGWTVFEEVTSQESDKTYLKPVSHPSSFGGCLQTIAKLKINNKSQYNSIKDYLSAYTKEHNKISDQFNLSI